MKVLFLSAYFYPEKISSSHIGDALREDCANNGIQMVLHVPMPTRGITNKERKFFKNKKYEEQYNGKVAIHRFSMYREGKNSILRALRYILVNIIQLYKSLRARDIDLLYLSSTPPTHGILAAMIKKLKKIPVVYSLQDVFPDSLVNSGFTTRNSILWKLGRKIEDFTYRNVDKIIVISEDFKENLLEKGVPEQKIEVVYNWVDENAVVPVKRDENKLFKDYNLDESFFYVVYAGNLGTAQNIEVILRTAKLLKDNVNIQFLLFGSGAEEEKYKNMAADMGLTNLLFFPLLSYDRVSEVYSAANVSIVSCKKGFGKSAMPSKTWSIMSAGTPVLASFDEGTNLQHIIEENNVGIFTKSDSEEEMKDAILRLYNDQTLCTKMGLNARDYILSNLTRKVGTGSYMKIMHSVMGEKYNV